MDITDKILADKRYKKIVNKLGNETLKLLASDNLKALEAAQKGIQQQEPERIDDVEYLEALAISMQELAIRALEERSEKQSEN